MEFLYHEEVERDGVHGRDVEIDRSVYRLTVLVVVGKHEV